MKFLSLLGAVSLGAFLMASSAAHADLIIAGNSAAFGDGPIGTWDFTTNTFLGSFIPTGAPPNNNGRGLAMTLDRYFYTELLDGFGATDQIRIAPYNGGLGGADIGFFANPAPGEGIQALSFGAAGLYVLTGYPNSAPTVHILNGVTGAQIGAPIVLQGADSGMDGFTVLADGSFIGNLGDADNLYTHWSAAGVNTGGNFSVPNCGSATGVDVSPDGLSLFFACNFNSFVQTSLTGAFIASISAPGGLWEDIAVQQQFLCTDPNGCNQVGPPGVPEPGSMTLLGSALAALGLMRRRRKTRA